MAHILTLAASDAQRSVSDAHIQRLKDHLIQNGIDMTHKPGWLAAGKAVDLFISKPLSYNDLNQIRPLLDPDKIDVFSTPVQNRRKRLLLADMDSTIVTGETLDELAGFAGLKDKISAITVRAMEGQLNFKDALRERVALLKGLDASALENVLGDIKLSAGAETLINTMRAEGCTCVLVSGGFTVFTSAVAEKLGFDHHHGNELEITGGALTGKVIEPILDKNAKVGFLEHYMRKLGLTAADCLTIGDGANDIPMLKAAGLGIGYKPKDAVAREIPNIIRHGDLTAALYAQGYSADSWT